MADYFTTLGAIGIVFIFAIREFFMYLKSRKDGNGNGKNTELEILKQRFLDFETNHKVHQKAIEDYMIKDAEWKNKLSIILGRIAQKVGIDIN